MCYSKASLPWHKCFSIVCSCLWYYRTKVRRIPNFNHHFRTCMVTIMNWLFYPDFPGIDRLFTSFPCKPMNLRFCKFFLLLIGISWRVLIIRQVLVTFLGRLYNTKYFVGFALSNLFILKSTVVIFIPNLYHFSRMKIVSALIFFYCW
jgi:hypothetical protein